MSTEEVPVLRELIGRVLVLTLNRPVRSNACSPALLDALSVALAEAGDDNKIRAIILTARGGTFTTGIDIGTAIDRNAAKALETKAADTCRLIMTGTPAGVGPLELGDRVTVEIEGIGTLENEVAGQGQAGG